MYKIPKEVLRKFHHVSARNRLENGNHIETLALLFGYKSESNFIGTHLIFPEQEGTCSRVDDKGKFHFAYHLLVMPSRIISSSFTSNFPKWFIYFEPFELFSHFSLFRHSGIQGYCFMVLWQSKYWKWEDSMPYCMDSFPCRWC